MSGKNFKKSRQVHQLTQIKLQTETGIEQSLISKYENGERVIPTETLELFADYFGVSTDYLLDRTDNPQPNI